MFWTSRGQSKQMTWSAACISSEECFFFFFFTHWRVQRLWASITIFFIWWNFYMKKIPSQIWQRRENWGRGVPPPFMLKKGKLLPWGKGAPHMFRSFRILHGTPIHTVLVQDCRVAMAMLGVLDSILIFSSIKRRLSRIGNQPFRAYCMELDRPPGSVQWLHLEKLAKASLDSKMGRNINTRNIFGPSGIQAYKWQSWTAWLLKSKHSQTIKTVPAETKYATIFL